MVDISCFYLGLNFEWFPTYGSLAKWNFLRKAIHHDLEVIEVTYDLRLVLYNQNLLAKVSEDLQLKPCRYFYNFIVTWALKTYFKVPVIIGLRSALIASRCSDNLWQCHFRPPHKKSAHYLMKCIHTGLYRGQKRSRSKKVRIQKKRVKMHSDQTKSIFIS